MEAIASPTQSNKTERPATSRLDQLISSYQPRLFRLSVVLSYLFIASLLLLGWINRQRQPFSAEDGIGYYLGIIGGSMMLLLLVYPLRKRIKALRVLGPIAWSFRLHMMLGILGPTLILFHCGFSLGSMNSNVALVCMLIVAGSGLIGRYVYKRIHHGLYGRKTSLAELHSHSDILNNTLTERLKALPELQRHLQQIHCRAAHDPRGILPSLIHYLTVGLRNWVTYLHLHTEVKRAVAALDQSERADIYRQILSHCRAYLEISRKIAEFDFYERLFSLWHLFHLPLFIMLLLSGIVHVFAVHFY